MAKEYNKDKKQLYAVSIYNEVPDTPPHKYHSVCFIKAEHMYAAFYSALLILKIPPFCKNLSWKCVAVPNPDMVD